MSWSLISKSSTTKIYTQFSKEDIVVNHLMSTAEQRSYPRTAIVQTRHYILSSISTIQCTSTFYLIRFFTRWNENLPLVPKKKISQDQTSCVRLLLQNTYFCLMYFSTYTNDIEVYVCGSLNALKPTLREQPRHTSSSRALVAILLEINTPPFDTNLTGKCIAIIYEPDSFEPLID